MPRITAAVLRHVGQPLSLETLEQSEPAERHVRVRVEATGLCHTDLEVMRGSISMPLPMVLGHEVAGVVEAVGSAVSTTVPGDRCVISWNPSCGHCFYCVRSQPLLCSTCAVAAAAGTLPDGRSTLRDRAGPVHQFMFLGGHASHVVVHERAVVPVPGELPFTIGAALGCGITTGAIPALRSDVLDAGATALVIGCGIVGLSVIVGARARGVESIIALDRVAGRRRMAAHLGADTVLDPDDSDPIQAVRRMTDGRGADHVFEATGAAAAMRLGFELTRPGGELTLLGKLGTDDELRLRWGAIAGNKTIRRLAYGGARPERDIPMLAAMHLSDRIDLAPIIDLELPLADIDAGFQAVARGACVRAVAVP